MTSVEKEILACSTELNPDLRQQQRMRHLMSHDMDVDHLIDIATKEGLPGLLYKNLMKSGVLENLDHKQRKRLQSIYYQTVRFNLQLIHELKEVLHWSIKRRSRWFSCRGLLSCSRSTMILA